jgi:hypothetical protein
MNRISDGMRSDMDRMLDQFVSESEAFYGKANSDDIAYHARIVADLFHVDFRFDLYGNVEWFPKD